VGYSIAWIAVQTPDQASLFERAQVRPTDEVDECFESPVSGTALNGGWFLLVGQGCDHRLIDRALLQSLSVRWPYVACSIEEHVMFSSAAFWHAGTEVWSASHDAQKGIFNLAVSGELPGSFDQLRESKFREQEAQGGPAADVDLIFEVPLLLAKELTGFKHDEAPTCLAQPAPVAFVDQVQHRRPWWKPW
jgi:hypothetical protein